MAKLNPPHLESKLPAFYIDDTTPVIKIPFELNRSVGVSQFNKMQILIKTVQTNIEVYNGSSSVIEDNVVTFQFPGNLLTTIENSTGEDHTALINKYIDGKTIKTNDLIIIEESGQKTVYIYINKKWEVSFRPQIGQYYKIQLAFIDTTQEIGYYSSVGVAKCTAQPEISIENLKSDDTNSNKYTYTGLYKNSDSNEKVYNYCFNIYDELGNLYESSGLLIHNATQDKELNSSTDTWSPKKGLVPGKTYTIQYSVKTLNSLEVKTVSYQIANNFLINPRDWFDGELHATLYKDDGYIELSLHGGTLYGKFILTRASNKDNFVTWNKITEFTVAKAPNGLILWRDFTIEQGVEYLYSIQMCNDKDVCTVHMINAEGKITADFEDMFLFDGKRQLKIRFNPKVSSFKNNRLEAKLETIGGQFPHFFRNGSVSYKEFPISGLISMLMDDNEFFMSGLKTINNIRTHTPSQDVAATAGRTQLITENIQAERDFKLEVLSWLQNGEFKLFRSPGEGNYIVRLLNISASPNDTLGRMIHTFNCTAYEAMEYSFENLKIWNYLNIADPIDLSSYHVTSSLDVFNVPFEGLLISGNKVTALDNRVMHNIVITNAAPRAKLLLTSGASTSTVQADFYGTFTIEGSWKSFEFIGIPTDTGDSIEDTVSIHTAILDFDFIESLSKYNNWTKFNKLSSVEILETTNYIDLYDTVHLSSAHVNDDHTLDYLQYLKDKAGEVGEVYYIYIKKRDLGTGVVGAHISYDIKLSSYNNKELVPTVISGGGRIYRDCGILSEFVCGNGFDVDIVYVRKNVT